MIFEKQMMKFKYNYTIVESGFEVIDLLQKEPFDLILLDMQMPGMDGAKTAEVLRENPGTKHIPVIFITCLFTKEDEKQGSMRGDTYFIAKPYDAEELMKVVEGYVE